MDIAAFLQGFAPPTQALLATIFTWSLTLFGASLVLSVTKVSTKLLSAAQGFAAGVMLAASVWSLINPAIELAEEQGGIPWVPAAVGVLLGVVFVAGALPILPYALTFAAGAMIFVVIEELIPESQNSGHTDLATLSALTGFVAMMVLDVALG